MSDVNAILNSIKEVPAMPNVIMRALSVMKDPDASTKDLAKIISYDQSLSTRVLALVNSAYYGFPQQITSITRALTLIGMSKAKNIIITVAMKPMLVNHGDKELWSHSIKTAVGCEYLASQLKIMDPDEAFVIGFLHDIGKVILNLKDSTLYDKVRQMEQMGTNLIDAEQAFFGADHAQLGGLLAKRWDLPLLIANVTKYHHSPNESSMQIPCTLVYLVDKLVQDSTENLTLDESVMKNLDINISQPSILKETILQKANVLLAELSN